MKLITHFELARMSKPELQTLFRMVSGRVAMYPQDSMERSNAIASLQNIQRELGMRPPGP